MKREPIDQVLKLKYIYTHVRTWSLTSNLVGRQICCYYLFGKGKTMLRRSPPRASVHSQYNCKNRKDFICMRPRSEALEGE